MHLLQNKRFLAALAIVVASVLTLLGVDVTEEAINEMFGQVGQIAALMTSLGGAVWLGIELRNKDGDE